MFRTREFDTGGHTVCILQFSALQDQLAYPVASMGDIGLKEGF
jgi:hypothetical protein